MDKAAVEAVVRRAIGKWSRNGNEDLEDLVDVFTDCLLAFAAAQRAEEREACAETVREELKYQSCTCSRRSQAAIRARREGPQ